MKKVLNALLVLFCLFVGYSLRSQTSNHPTINSFGVKYEDGNPEAVSNTMDSAVIITYVLELKDTVNVAKIHVRINSGKKAGKEFNANYLINSKPQKDAKGQVVFHREKNTVYISTINSTQLANDNFEVATENKQGQLSPYLNWKSK